MSIDKAEFKQRIRAAQAELHALSATTADAAKPVELDQTRVGRVSRMDAMQSQAMSLEVKRRQELQLKQLDAALKRLADDDYGYCVRCGGEIGIERLKVTLTTLLCIACAEQGEKNP